MAGESMILIVSRCLRNRLAPETPAMSIGEICAIVFVSLKRLQTPGFH
jgi:hypothetical protein